MLKNQVFKCVVFLLFSLLLQYTPVGAQAFKAPGQVLSSFQANYDYYAQLRPTAKDSIERAIAQLPATPSDTVAIAYYMLCNDQLLKNNGAAADGYIQKGFKAAATNEARAPLYQLDEQLATNLLYDYTRSLYSNQKSVECYEEYEDYGTASFSKINLAFAYIRFGHCDKAEAQVAVAMDYFKQHLKQIPEASVPNIEANLTSFGAFIQGQAAICKGERTYLNGNTDSSLVYYGRGIDALKPLEGIQDPLKAGVVHFALSRAKLMTQQPLTAVLPHLDKAQAAFEYGGQSFENAMVQIARGYALVKAGRLADTTLLLNGLSVLVGKPVKNLFQNIDPQYFERSKGLNLYYLKEAFLYKVRLLDALFEATKKQPYLIQKGKDLNTILEIAQAQKLIAADEETLYTIDVQFASIYRMSAANAFRLWETTKDTKHLDVCWRFVQESKEATMQSRVSLRTAAMEPGPLGKLAKEENQKRDEIRKKYQAFLLSLPQTTDNAEKEQAWLEAKQDYTAWLQQLANGNETEQNFYRQRYKEKGLSRKNSAQALPADVTLVEYFYLNDRELVAFVLSNEGDYVKKITLTPEANTQLADWAAQLKKSHYDYERFFKAALAAYQNYFEPVASLVKTSRVVVCGDRTLAAIPFEAMIWAKPEDYTTYNVDRYLVYKYAFSYNYSAFFCLQGYLAPEENQPYALDWLGMAPYMKEMEPEQGDCPESKHWRSNESTVPESGLSVETISEHLLRENAQLRTKSYFHEDATKATFEEWAGKTRYLYLNTHGLFGTQQSSEPTILFYPACHSLGILHFGLSTSQIYTMRIPAELAFINTCQSYAGNWQDGIGLLSISRAFTFAGTKNVVSNRWDADGSYAANLGIMFFDVAISSKTPSSPDLVLTSVKQKSIELFPPQIWANSVIVSNLRSLKLR